LVADDEKWYKSYDYLRILDLLEKSFTKFGVASYEGDPKSPGGCRQKLVCEVYLTNALNVNRNAASAIAGVIGYEKHYRLKE